MAQTRRMGKRNRRADRPKAPRFSPYRIGQDHADRSPRPLALSTCRLASLCWRAWATAGYRAIFIRSLLPPSGLRRTSRDDSSRRKSLPFIL